MMNNTGVNRRKQSTRPDTLKPKSYQIKALEPILLAKELYLFLAASVALVASLLIHPNLAAIMLPILGAL